MSLTWGSGRKAINIVGETLLIDEGTADSLRSASLAVKEIQAFVDNAEVWIAKAKETIGRYVDQDDIAKMIEKGETILRNLTARQKILGTLNEKCKKEEKTETSNQLSRIEMKFGLLELEIQTTLDALKARLSTFQ